MNALRFHAAGDPRMEHLPEPGDPGRDQFLDSNYLAEIRGADLHEDADRPILIPPGNIVVRSVSLDNAVGRTCSADRPAGEPSKILIRLQAAA